MKIIFLDVDGVLYPYHDRKFLTKKPEKIKRSLSEKIVSLNRQMH